MKRSQINRAIERAIAFFNQMNIHLPPFAFWRPEEWARKGHEVDEIRNTMLGWDVTGFGSGDFHRIGRTLFTLRNGSYRHEQYPKPYSEKISLLEEEQVAPLHYHVRKMEDIINRGGGNILVLLYQATAEGEKSPEPFEVAVDGCRKSISAGGIIRLRPGESICLLPRTIHQFWSEKGTGLTVCGEISSVCDDLTDNYFLEEVSRFPTIEEDDPPMFLLCNEYPAPCKDEMDKGCKKSPLRTILPL